VAYADLVISAGGTMNREGVALGTPVFTTFEGRLGAVDEGLLREGRMRKLDDPSQIEIGRRSANGGLRIRRDPRELVTMLLAASET
jgi:predicted glycosyltransferase